MGKIFIWLDRTKQEGYSYPNPVQDIQQLRLLQEQVVTELRSRGCEVFAVPDDLSLAASIQWINDHAVERDVALAIGNNCDRLLGTSIFHIANNVERKKHAELILLLLIRHFPEIASQGSKPDTVTEVGSLAFCRQVIIPSLVINVGFLGDSNNSEMVLGLADGLIAWSREVSDLEDDSASIYPSINIKLNQQIYEEQGILINGNAYIPVDLCDRLGIDFTQSCNVRLVGDRGVVYLKAIELRDRNFSVRWDNLSQTVILRSILSINREQIDCIMGQGNTSEVQMIMFLKSNHENGLKQFPNLPKIYREEGTIEGVNYDIAFCQMCLETDFLGFRDNVQPAWNNFANLAAVGGGAKLASFSEPHLGVRSHIQHLKAYASLEPLVQEVIDPRFHFVRRGIAPKVSQLSGRWSANLAYGKRIMAMLRRLYECANLL
jgi:hypothetical protein